MTGWWTALLDGEEHRRIRVRPEQLPRKTWRCWFHRLPAISDAVFVWDVRDGQFAGMLCRCGAFRWPTDSWKPAAQEEKLDKEPTR